MRGTLLRNLERKLSIYKPLENKTCSLHFPIDYHWACLKDYALSGAPALAPYCSNPHQTVPRAAPESRRSTSDRRSEV